MFSPPPTIVISIITFGAAAPGLAVFRKQLFYFYTTAGVIKPASISHQAGASAQSNALCEKGDWEENKTKQGVFSGQNAFLSSRVL